MVYTPKIQKAISFAINVHLTQKRKGKETPYIVHPLSVGLILARVSADEDIICAGILHDTIEDCEPYGSITKEILEKEFGAKVAEMVNDVTEQDKNLSWEVRKQQALEHIKDMGKASVLVKSADVLHNLTDQLNDYDKDGEATFARFNAPKEKQLARYENLFKELSKSSPENPLLPDLEKVVEKVKKLWS